MRRRDREDAGAESGPAVDDSPRRTAARPSPTRNAWARAGLLLAGLASVGCNCGDNLRREGYACDASTNLVNIITNLLISPNLDKGGTESGRPARSSAAKAQRIVTQPNTLTFVAPADVPAPNFGEVTLPLDLIPPFRVECTVGLCDEAFYPAPTAVFGFSVVERTGAQREFSADCSRVGGITATASFGTPTPRAFAGAERVDLAFEHDGTDLVAYARKRDAAAPWTEVSRAAVAATGPFLPKLSALNFEPGQMVSYYSLRVRANAPYALGQATPQHQAVRAMAEALNALADGADELVSATPDAAAARQRFEAASQLVRDAVAALDVAAGPGKKDPDARRLKKARKAALKAAKGVTKAVGNLDVNTSRGEAAVMKGVGSAALSLAQAGDQVLPDDLRAAIGGLTFKSFLGK
jgi:hypothetical protein